MVDEKALPIIGRRAARTECHVGLDGNGRREGSAFSAGKHG